MQEREHVSTYNFHSTFGDTLSQFQYAKVLAYNQTHHVKPWPIVQMLAAQDAEQRFDYNTEEASIDDLFATVDFGSQGVHNPVREAGLAAVKEEPAGKSSAHALVVPPRLTLLLEAGSLPKLRSGVSAI